MDFYLIINGKQEGPFPKDELINKGITPETEVWTDGMSDWTPAADVPELTDVMQQLQFMQHQQTQQQAAAAQPETTTRPTPPPMRAQAAPAETKKSGKGMKWLIALLILAVLFGAMAMTCPDKDKHVEAISQVANEWVEEKVDDVGITGLINSFIKAIADKGANGLLDNFLKVDNYVVCSVGKVKVEGKEKTVSVGLFNHVFTFGKDDIEKAYQEQKDKYLDDIKEGIGALLGGFTADNDAANGDSIAAAISGGLGAANSLIGSVSQAVSQAKNGIQEIINGIQEITNMFAAPETEEQEGVLTPPDPDPQTEPQPAE